VRDVRSQEPADNPAEEKHNKKQQRTGYFAPLNEKCNIDCRGILHGEKEQEPD